MAVQNPIVSIVGVLIGLLFLVAVIVGVVFLIIYLTKKK